MNAQTPTEQLINALQSHGVRLVDPKAGVESRRGGAGPSDHKAITIDGVTVMIPVHTAPAFDSPYVAEAPDSTGNSRITRDGVSLGSISFPKRPRFYDLATADGVPYSKIAVLHGRDVLATTVLQTCIRYQSRTKTCQFCAIGQSLAAGRTVERKTPSRVPYSRGGAWPAVSLFLERPRRPRAWSRPGPLRPERGVPASLPA